ncbi:MAG: HAD hydrolase-like protein [Rhodocyclaceae bacterium]|nr:HAD hydrolase-like protein [Rhodocyclaceae bacterium]
MRSSGACLPERFRRDTRLIFWDFDGVIKDSIAVKTEAFVQLFESFGGEVARRIRLHHEAHGGMSRFEKIPLYMEWAGVPVTESGVKAYCQHFSDIVLRQVINAPWVAGVERILRENPYAQEFILVTATPQGEITEILKAIDLRHCFSEVFGAPTKKGAAICSCLSRRNVPLDRCLMIGDARADMDAALENDIPFLLRRHASNHEVFCNFTGDSVEDFVEL